MRKMITGMLWVICLMLIMTPQAARSQEKKSLSKEDTKKYEDSFDSALLHYEKAKLLYDQKKLKETVKELQAIIALDFPKGSEAMDGYKMQLDMYEFLGSVYLEMDDAKKAIKVLGDGLEKAPDISEQSYHLHMAMGRALKETKEIDKALAEFEKAEKIDKELKKQEEKNKKKDDKKDK